MKNFDFKVAKYAKALVRVGAEGGFLDSIDADIKSLKNSLLGQKNYMLNYILTDEVIQKLENNGVNIYLLSIFKVMKKNKDINLLLAFFDYWAILYNKSSNILDVEVYSVIQLNDVQIMGIEDILKQRFEQKFKVRNIVKKDILGGLVIKAGNYIFDDSFFSKLFSLKRENEV